MTDTRPEPDAEAVADTRATDSNGEVRETGDQLRRGALPGPAAAAAAPRSPARALPAAQQGTRRPAQGRQPRLRLLAARAVDARRRVRVRQAVLRAGEHVAEPVRQPRRPRGDREGVRLVHRVPDLHDHQARHLLPRHARRRRPVVGLRGDRHRRRAHRPAQEGRRHPRLGVDAERRRPLRPDQHPDRRRVRHRGRVPHDDRGRRGAPRHDHRRHRARPHRQGRRLPAGRDEGRRLPRDLPHGGDRGEGLAPAAQGPQGPRLGQPRHRGRVDAGQAGLHHRPAAAGDLLRARRQGHQLERHAAGARAGRRRAPLGLPALLQGGPALDQLARPQLRRHAAGHRGRAALPRRPRQRRAAPRRQRLPRRGEEPGGLARPGRRATRCPRRPTS